MRYKILVYILFILFALGLICIGHMSHAQGRPGSLYTATVLRIIDGDTIHVRDMAERHAFLEHLRAHVLSFTIYKSNLAVILINTLNLQADYACVQQFA